MNNIKPILFSGPMVRALIEGRKTQTRRVLKPQPPKDQLGGEYIHRLFGPEWYEPAVVKGDEIVPGKPIWGVYDEYGDFGARVPYMPGDLLWVREKAYYGPNRIAYAADNVPIGGRDRVEGWGPARSSIHMPRWASRLTLEVTNVRIQRLQDISYDDAIAEGIEPVDEFPAGNKRWRDYLGLRSGCSSPILSFSTLWDSINAKSGFSYDQNPWVIALTFIVHQMNIDEFLAQREAA